MKKLPTTFKELMEKREWEQSLALLKKKKRMIIVAKADSVAGHGGHVLVDGDGFKEWSGVVGEAAAYTNEKPTITLLNTPVKILAAIQECDNHESPQLSEAKLITNLVRNLRRINLEPR
ncbi:MAG: hypothetical protein WC884_01265 [Candidatus Paceibacterota bacterium]